MAASILWYDLETFGIDPRYDRIVQFACIRTDESLREIEEPVVLFCRPGPDYLPSPLACLVHGITPQHAVEAGLSEHEFALRILSQMARPGTTTAGYNSIKFDDEFIRNLLYRTLHDPYGREWADGNSRWDAIGLVRAARDLRPEGIVWPQGEDGKPLFKLEALAKANGIALASAHDALHDIRATIGVARLVKLRQPRLYDWYYSHRRRESLKPLVNLASGRMLVHTAPEYTTQAGCSTLIAPLALDPAVRSQIVAMDLRFDPESVVDLGVEELRARVFAKAGTGQRLPLSRIRLNHCPFLAPGSILTKSAAERLGLDAALCAKRAAWLAAHPELAQKLIAVFETPAPREESDDPDLRLYSGGFIGDADRSRLARLHGILAESGPNAAKEAVRDLGLEDPRLPKLAGRFFARNFPESLSGSEKAKWRAYCARRLQLPPREGAAEIADYSGFIASRLADPAMPARDRHILHSLLEWKSKLEREVLAYDA